MKNKLSLFVMIAAILTALIAFTACQSNSSTVSSEGDNNQTNSSEIENSSEEVKSNVQLSNEEVTNMAKESLGKLNLCEEEIFGAAVNFEDEFIAVYEKDSSEKFILIKQEDREKYAEYTDDPSAASYYLVSNYKKSSEINENLSPYIDKAILDSYKIDNGFVEYNNELYIVRGGRGYGAGKYDVNTIKFVSEKNGEYEFSCDYLLFDEKDGIKTLIFKIVDNKAVLTKVS